MLIRFYKMINNSNQFFDGMRYCNVIMLAFSSFLGKIFGKCRIPVANILGCIVQGIS